MYCHLNALTAAMRMTLNLDTSMTPARIPLATLACLSLSTFFDQSALQRRQAARLSQTQQASRLLLRADESNFGSRSNEDKP
jgi:hypothetical protein